MASSGWDHKTPAEHPVEPRYAATGEWVCYVCREPVVLDGRKPFMGVVKGLDVFAAPQTLDPDQPGLQVEGS